MDTLLDAKSSSELGSNFANVFLDPSQTNQELKKTLFLVMGTLYDQSSKTSFSEFWTSFIQIWISGMEANQNKYTSIDNITDTSTNTETDSIESDTKFQLVEFLSNVWDFIIPRWDHVPIFLSSFERTLTFAFNLSSMFPVSKKPREIAMFNFYKQLLKALLNLIQKHNQTLAKSPALLNSIGRIISIYCFTHYSLRQLIFYLPEEHKSQQGTTSSSSSTGTTSNTAPVKKIDQLHPLIEHFSESTTEKTKKDSIATQKGKSVLSSAFMDCKIFELNLIKMLLSLSSWLQLDPLLYLARQFYPYFNYGTPIEQSKDPLGDVIEFLKRHLYLQHLSFNGYRNPCPLWTPNVISYLQSLTNAFSTVHQAARIIPNTQASTSSP